MGALIRRNPKTTALANRELSIGSMQDTSLTQQPLNNIRRRNNKNKNKIKNNSNDIDNDNDSNMDTYAHAPTQPDPMIRTGYNGNLLFDPNLENMVCLKPQ